MDSFDSQYARVTTDGPLIVYISVFLSGMKTAMEVITSGIPELPCGQNCLPNVKQNLPRCRWKIDKRT